MEIKYIKKPTSNKVKGDGRPGRYVDPSAWKTGPDLLTREKYYAYLKHKAQCNFRREPHNLTWEDWQECWTDDLFLRRGKRRDSLIMQRIKLDQPWQRDNVQITTRGEHLQRAREYRHNDKDI